jgi:hypothetical protein
LKEKLPEFFEEARQHPAFAIVDVNLKFNKPELKISIDRQRAEILVYLQLILPKLFRLHSADSDLAIL